jgi:hypothetical protein
MLDPRIYRAGFVPLLFALVVVAFSLRDEPKPIGSSLPAQAFDGTSALTTLRSLQADKALRDRPPAGPGDDVLAGRVSAVLRSRRFGVTTRRLQAETAVGARTLTAVVGSRTGFSNRRIVVIAHRDAVRGPAGGRLSATAALLELARVLGGRTLARNLDLVSLSGSDGGAGAEAYARSLRGPVEGVIVLGDPGGAGTERPWVAPFSSGSQLAPLRLRGTVEAAVRAETAESPGGVSPVRQWFRLAVPLTLGAQGPFLARGIPAVQVGPGGERGGGFEEQVSATRLESFGRATLRAVTALDGGPGVGRPSRYIVVARKVLPEWAVRLLVGALILPALLAGIDGFARVRRRREPVGMWLRWALAGTLPFVVAVLGLYALRATNLLVAAPPEPVAAGVIPTGATAWIVAGALAAIIALGWLALRPLALRALAVRGDPSSPGAASALMLALCAIAVVAWIVNPYLAALLVPALHLWSLAVAPEPRLRTSVRVVLVLLGLLPLAVLAFSYGAQFGLDPLQELWAASLLVAGGGVSWLAALAWCAVLGAAGGIAASVLRGARGRESGEAPVTVRGPGSYAGPGSLGGTESALRR